MAYTNIEDQREASRKHYKNNKSDYADRRDRRRIAIRKFIKELKSKLKCSRCPETDPRCIDFHHEDPSKKVISIASIPSFGWALERIREEISKCIPLCVNCHRKETLK